MASDRGDGDYLGAYRRFFDDFVSRVNPDDQLPVKLSGYDVTEGEITGEIIDWTLQYLNQKYCPPSLQSYVVHLVIEEVKQMCKKQPEAYGWRPKENTYAPLRLMHAVTSKVNEICLRYLDNSRLALLPPPPSTPMPLATACAIKNSRRKMEDRHVVIHDLHTIFSIQEDSTGSYYAVFDGHAGQEAAVYCAAHLHQYLAESIHYPTNPERALRDAFLTTDAHFIEKSNKQNLSSGTTAVCALLLNRKLYVAWVGDSQAVLAKRGQVTQLVNPHKPERADEKERVEDMGGTVIHWGIWRVNGQLAVSRAIGDVYYKPYVTGDPDVRSVALDGTEDFLILACDGLWDFVSEAVAATLVYQQVREDPCDLEAVSQNLVQYSKSQGSTDNISAIVVFLTPPRQIAARPISAHPLPADVQLNNMESNNPFLSNANGQFEINPAFGKQQTNGATQQEDNYLFDKPSNGKHANGRTEYDDEDDDLGPETDVDAVDDAHESCTPLETLSRELFPEKLGERELFHPEEPLDDHSPPTPHAQPQQHALIPDTDNVADSEDSEDEWNYYRIDPNKDKEPATPVEASECKGEKEANSPEPLKVDSEYISNESQEANLGDNPECEKEIQQPELIDSDICAKTELQEEFACEQEEEDMDFQLNPNAAEFVPVSPSRVLPARANLGDDIPLSGSPHKQTPVMDDISVPSHGDFQKEVSCRPSEVEYANGDQNPRTEFTDYLLDRQKGAAVGLDDSEISSTKAEFGDESSTSFMTASEFHRTGISNVDGSFTGSEREEYDIARDPMSEISFTPGKFEAAKDPMTMSFTPGDFEAAFDKGCDLNAVHQLDDSDLVGEEDDGARENGFTVLSPDLHPELTTLVTPDTDHPPPSVAFPDSQTTNLMDASSPLPHEEPLESTLLEIVDKQSQATTNLIDAEPEVKPSLVDFSVDEQVPSESVDDLNVHDATSPAPEVEIPVPYSRQETAPLLDAAASFGSDSVESILKGSEAASDIPVEKHDFLTPEPAEPAISPAPVEVKTSSPEPELSEVAPSPIPPFDSQAEPVSSPIPDTVPHATDSVIPLLSDTPESVSPAPDFAGQIQESDLLPTLSDSTPAVKAEDSEALNIPDVSFLQNPLDLNVETASHPRTTEPKSEFEFEPSVTTDSLLEAQREEYTTEIPSSPIPPSGTLEEASSILETSVVNQQPEETLLGNDVSELSSAAPYEDIQVQQLEAELICPRPSSVKEDIVRSLDFAEEEETQTPLSETNSKQDTDKLETTTKDEPLGGIPILNLSESLQEFTGLEQQLNPEKDVASTNGITFDIHEEIDSQIPVIDAVKDTPEQIITAQDIPEQKITAQDVAQDITEQKFTAEDSSKVISDQIITEVSPQETSEQKIIAEDVVLETCERKTTAVDSVQEISEQKIPAEDAVQTKPEQSAIVEDIKAAEAQTIQEEPAKVESSQEIQTPVTSEPKEPQIPSELPAAAIIAAAAIAGSAAAATKSTKAKPASKTSKTAPTSKPSLRSTPSSPTKPSTAARSTLAPKRPTPGLASRQKPADAPKPTSNGTAPKPAATKTTTATTKPAPRTSTLTARPKPAVAPLKSATTERKPTTNGDVKPLGKPTGLKPAVKPAVGAAAPKPLVKSTAPVSRTVLGAAARPTSAVTTAKPKPAATGAAAGISPRPKTAPSATTVKSRLSASKSPVTDKQTKETANKQISSGRVSATSTSTRTSRPSSSATATVRRATAAKTSTAVSPPAKKPPPISRQGAKASAAASAAAKSAKSTATSKTKIVQNGVSETRETETVTSKNVDEDVPKKDVSPVTAPADNQLIMAAD